MYRPAEVQSRESVELERPVATRQSKRKRWVIAILALVGVFVVLVGIKTAQIMTMIKAGKAMTPPPESVTSAKVEQVEWQPVRQAVGTLIAIRGVTLGTELTGTVRQINFENGSLVKKGAVLVRFDTSSEQAQLQSAVADAALAKQTLERAENLRKQEVNTQAELEAAQARDKQTRATVNNLQAIIGKKVIRAPFDGRVGIRAVELGQVLSPGTPIISLQTVSPIYAEFQLPQQSLADVKVGQQISLKVDVFPKESWEGTVTTINPEVDPGTRNVRMRATVENPDGRLNPGMFASVVVQSGEKGQAIVVPATSVIFAPYGDSVYVIEQQKDEGDKAGQPKGEGEKPKAPAGKAAAQKPGGDKPALIARQRFVRLGERRGDFVAVVSGLAPGETVVSNGAFKLHNGESVMINNALAPAAQFVPSPVDR
jgi:membrane fusion protein (multidrug efflux system)